MLYMNKISATCNQLIGYMAYLIACTPQQTQTQSLTQTNPISSTSR